MHTQDLEGIVVPALDDAPEEAGPITFEAARETLLAEARAEGSRVIPAELDRLAWERVWERDRSRNMKRLDAAVFGTITDALEGNFQGGGTYVATLSNGGVGVAPFHDFEDLVPDNIKEDLKAIESGIINGTISTGYPPPE